jgi:hypothetical protein
MRLASVPADGRLRPALVLVDGEHFLMAKPKPHAEPDLFNSTPTKPPRTLALIEREILELEGEIASRRKRLTKLKRERAARIGRMASGPRPVLYPPEHIRSRFNELGGKRGSVAALARELGCATKTVHRALVQH